MLPQPITGLFAYCWGRLSPGARQQRAQSRLERSTRSQISGAGVGHLRRTGALRCGAARLRREAVGHCRRAGYPLREGVSRSGRGLGTNGDERIIGWSPPASAACRSFGQEVSRASGCATPRGDHDFIRFTLCDAVCLAARCPHDADAAGGRRSGLPGRSWWSGWSRGPRFALWSGRSLVALWTLHGFATGHQCEKAAQNNEKGTHECFLRPRAWPANCQRHAT